MTKEQIINLMENEDVTTFFVLYIGGFEEDAYDAVLEVKELYPHIHITLVISKITELHPVGEDISNYIHINTNNIYTTSTKQLTENT